MISLLRHHPDPVLTRGEVLARETARIYAEERAAAEKRTAHRVARVVETRRRVAVTVPSGHRGGNRTPRPAPTTPKIGQRFGLLTVTEAPYRDNGVVRVPCRCDCGGEKHPLRHNLIDGRTRSCGCLAGKQNWKVTEAQR